MRETDQETDDDEEFSSLIEETPSLEIELSSFSFSPGRDVDGGSDRNRQQRIVGSGPGAKESRRRLLLHHSLKRKCFILLATISLFAGLIAIHVIQTKENGDLMKESSKYHINNLHENVTISCPLEIDKSANDKDAMLSEFYDDFNKKTISKTVDLKKLKNSSYDGWGKNYNQFKTDIYQWKCQHFSTLKSGETIFESGCGSGLNLLMTVETLKECANIDHLQVYGIEYVKSSVEEANLVLDQLLPQVGNATLGSQICQGDASDLFFIPSNSFDLSYTGYIDPIQDPLNFHLELGRPIKWKDFCKSKYTPTKKGKEDQAAQSEWYRKWVSELIRITKPGQNIIVEQVSQPYCTDKNDWGGVAKEWWYDTVQRYGWNIDVNSIVIQDLDQGQTPKGLRYNIFMKKTS